MKIIHLTDSEFKTLVKKLKSLGVNNPKNNNYAFTVTMEYSSPIIIYNKECGLNNDYKQIVIQHERAHYHGVYGEEDADLWALKRLNKKQRKILINQWKSRHGHNYKKM